MQAHVSPSLSALPSKPIHTCLALSTGHKPPTFDPLHDSTAVAPTIALPQPQQHARYAHSHALAGHRR